MEFHMNDIAGQNKSGLGRALVFAGLFYILIPFAIYVAARHGLVTGAVRTILTNSITLYIIPTLIYLGFSDGKDTVRFLKLRGNAVQGMVWGVGIGLIFAGYGLAMNQFYRGGIINLDHATGIWIWAIALVGILQEIPFRGFLLQKLQGGMSFFTANIITALFFVVFHIPRWYFRGQFRVFPPAVLFVFSSSWGIF
jgi:membrane protease YdiL (CAAX protease family)